MSRSACCIQMLVLLKARGFMTREELAQELHCNKRNIIEYKKELEEAGYTIISNRGKYGGYALERSTLLPLLNFTMDEQHALQEGRHYLMSRPDFLLQDTYNKAMDKLQANLQQLQEESSIYMPRGNINITKRMQQAIRICEQAKKQQQCIELSYRSMHAKEYITTRVHPYEIINYKGSYYCLAYSLKAKDYRTYKFSEERMRDVKLLPQYFQREQEFKLKEHIGKSGLVKEEPYEIELYIYHETARRISEEVIGIEPSMEWINTDTLYLKTILEGKLDTIAFLLSLKGDCKLIAPSDLKEEMLKIIEDMKYAYSNS